MKATPTAVDGGAWPPQRQRQRRQRPVASRRIPRAFGLLHLLLSAAPGPLAAAVALGLLAGAMFTASLVALNALVQSPAGWLDATRIALALSWVVAVAALSLGSASVTARVLLKQLTALRLRLVQRLLAASLAALEAQGSARLLALVVDEVQRVAQGVWALPVLLLNLGICVTAYAYLGWVNPLLLAVTLAVQGVGFVLVGWVFARFLPLSNAAAAQRQQMIDQIQACTVQLCGFKQTAELRDAFMGLLLAPTLQRLQQATLRTIHSAATMDALVKAIFLIVLLLLAAATALPGLVPLAQVQAALVTFLFVVTPFSALLDSAQKLADAEQAWRRLHAFDVEAEAAGAVPAATGAQQMVALQDVDFRYRDAAGRAGFAVRGLHLQLRRGEIVALRGGNGSGKTTVAKLLCGLYVPERGQLLADHAAVPAEALPAHREALAALWAEQPPALLWFPLDPARAQEAAQWWDRFGLQDVQPFATGWVACARLSTGQRARAALVAMLALGRPFLVLDEWAAHQDAEYRDLFYVELLPALRAQGRGVLLISHDAQAAAVADRVHELSHPEAPC